MKIICPEHGEFEQLPKHHLNGVIGCYGCREITNEVYINKANMVHNNLYDYSKINYINNSTKIIIGCKKYGHGDFKQTPQNHLSGRGCPRCQNSSGEMTINKILTDNNINFETQKKFDDCIKEKKLSFDFYLPDYQMCIEYDGKQHYEPVKWFGGKKTMDGIIERDKIKTNFCLKNDIKLIRIKHDENIEEKLKCLTLH